MKAEFRSDAMDEAGLPLGTPLNKYQPDWKPLPAPRWMLRRDLKKLAEQGKPDPMLPRGSDRCWCNDCGLYFNSTFAFARHRTGEPIERRCRSVLELRSSGWTQGPKGHWRTPHSSVRGLRGTFSP